MHKLKILAAVLVAVMVIAAFIPVNGWKLAVLATLEAISLLVFTWLVGKLRREQNTAKKLFVYIEDCGCCRCIQTATVQDALQRIKDEYDPGGELFQRIDIPPLASVDTNRLHYVIQILKNVPRFKPKESHHV